MTCDFTPRSAEFIEVNPDALPSAAGAAVRLTFGFPGIGDNGRPSSILDCVIPVDDPGCEEWHRTRIIDDCWRHLRRYFDGDGLDGDMANIFCCEGDLPAGQEESLQDELRRIERDFMAVGWRQEAS